MWRSYETNWDENLGWRYFEERKTVFEVVVFIFEGVGVTASGLGVKFLKENVLRERMNIGTHMSGPGWSNGGMCTSFVRRGYVARLGWLWSFDVFIRGMDGWDSLRRLGFYRFQILELSHPACMFKCWFYYHLFFIFKFTSNFSFLKLLGFVY